MYQQYIGLVIWIIITEKKNTDFLFFTANEQAQLLMRIAILATHKFTLQNVFLFEVKTLNYLLRGESMKRFRHTLGEPNGDVQPKTCCGRAAPGSKQSQSHSSNGKLDADELSLSSTSSSLDELSELTNTRRQSSPSGSKISIKSFSGPVRLQPKIKLLYNTLLVLFRLILLLLD